MMYENTWQKEYQRRKAQQFDEAGVCVICGRERTDGFKTCAACRARASANGKRRWDAIKAKVNATGICYKCGEKPVRKGQLMCPLCAFKEAERKAKYRAKRVQKAKELGLCVECMKAKAKPGIMMCMACALKESERKRNYYWKTKAEVALCRK